MYGSRLRLSRTLVVATGLVLCASVLSGTASADTLLQKKQAQYARVRSQVRKLDSHIELLTERYDQVRWHLHVLHREIHVATVRLVAEEAELKRQQQNLAQLVIEQYKGGDPQDARDRARLVVALADHERHGS